MNESYQQPGRWHDVILTPAQRKSSAEPSEHIMSFHLHGLQPSSVYEAIVQAKNRYGWNEVSLDCLGDTFALTTEPNASPIELPAHLSVTLPFPIRCLQVSDIFQFYTQRSSSDPRVDGVEHVAMSTTRNAATSPRSCASSLIHFVILLGVLFLLVPRTVSTRTTL